MVTDAANNCKDCFRPLYKKETSVEEKVNIIATRLYGAAGVEYSMDARKALQVIETLGMSQAPVCIAKTQKSLSDNPLLKNRPTGFIVNVRDIEISAGAGFIVPICGEIMRMPGLPDVPSAELIDIDEHGNITGLF